MIIHLSNDSHLPNGYIKIFINWKEKEKIKVICVTKFENIFGKWIFKFVTQITLPNECHLSNGLIKIFLKIEKEFFIVKRKNQTYLFNKIC